ncbi:ABC transporter ATP-binding protein/permease [Candidatus Pelagibacter sp.]|nr:ABC transporter ATP-binding protein/permease [Candidatus Pelagibacter sp.]
MDTIKKLSFLLTPIERRNALLLLLMFVIMALIDMIGVASILPFMAVLTNPSLIETNMILNYMYQVSNIFGVENDQEFFFALGFLVFIILIISLIFKAITTYIEVKFLQMCEYNVSKRLVEGYLYQPYIWFLNRNSAELGKSILSQVSIVIDIMRSLMSLISKSIIAIALIALLIIANPKLSMIVGLTLSLTYGIIFYFTRKYLNSLGKENLKNDELRFIAVSEAFGAAKEIKVGGLERAYIKSYSNAAKIFAQNKAILKVISQLPRYILEGIAFGGIMLLILYLMSQEGSFNNAIPIISLYAFAGYRLMPVMQNIYMSLSQISFSSPSLDNLYYDIGKLNPIKNNYLEEKLSFDKEIVLNNIDFNYPNTSQKALQGISLNIPAKSTIGLIGATGSGKTTLLDIILGLLMSDKGTLEIDGEVLSKKNLRSWQRNIGYVPQHIYLSDDTIAANIAFGVESKNINQIDIERASKIANLHDFIINELPDKYNTTIGERGIRLSGGQRQRIGIARAVYLNPKILILDEGTSALDNETEKKVMEAINKLSKKITIILVAHRLNTVRNCDKIYKFEKGKVIAEGKFDEIINTN